jgi:hypothetical protein
MGLSTRRGLVTALVTALALVLSSAHVRAEASACNEETLNAWALGCAWAVRAARIAELPLSDDPWQRISPPFFETHGDLVSEWLSACHELTAERERIPEASREMLERLKWPESGATCTHEEELAWLRGCYEDAESMRLRTRRDLYSKFEKEGGISTPSHRTFIHHRCQMLKVVVRFESSTGSMPETESLDDVVIEIVPEIGVFFPG